MKQRRKSRIRSTAFAVITCAAVALSPSQASASTVEADRGAVLERINAARTAQGACPLTLDEGVQATSQAWSSHMGASGRLAHNANRPRGAGASGENVGMAGDAVGVYERFLASPRHLSNMMNPSFDRAGIGIEQAGGRTWVTINFTEANTNGC